MSFSDWSNDKKKKEENERKEREEIRNKNTQAVLGNKTSFSDWSNNKRAEGVNDEYISTFVADANSFFDRAGKDYSNIGYSNVSASYSTNLTTWSDIETRATAISAWLERNKDNVDDDYYKNLSQMIRTVRSNGSSLIESFKSSNDFITQNFNSDDEYNKWYEGYKEQQDILNSDDLDRYVQEGLNVSNPSWEDTYAPVEIFGWTPFGDGEEVNNMVTFAEANKEKAMGESGNALRGGGSSDEQTQLVNLINTHMTDEEKSIYNYYIGKGEIDKANEYLTNLKDTLVQRQAGAIVEQADDTALEYVMAAVAGLDQFATGVKNLGNFITGGDASPTTAIQYAWSEMGSNNEGLFGVTTDLMNTTAHMLPSILVGTFTGGLGGAITLGASAVGNGYAEMKRLGYNDWQARGYGLLVGASETALQYALGGISKLGGKLSGNVVGKFVSSLDNALARTAIQLGGNMVSEGLEEAIQTVVEPAFKAWVTGEDYDAPELEEVLYSALLGALSAGVLEGAPTIAGTAINSYRANKVYGADPKALVTEALEIDANNEHAQRMQARLDGGKNVSGYQLNRLVESNESALYSQDTAKIKSAAEARLTELGERGDVGKLADALVKQASGERLSLSDKNIIKNSTYGQRVSNELSPTNIESGEYSSAWAENLGTERINVQAYNNDADIEVYDRAVKQVSMAEPPEDEPADKNASAKENLTETKFEVSTDGKTKIGDLEVSIKEIASVKDGEVILRLEDGSTVNASDVEYGSSEEGLLYENVVNMNLNPATANAFVKGYDPSLSVQQYALGFREAYRYGEYGYPVQEMSAKGFSAMLSESQKSLAYNLGKTDAKYKIDAKSAKIASTGAIKVGKDSQKTSKKGKLHNTIAPSTERQRASLKALGTLAETLGIDIYTFESQVVNGKRQGANGWFDPKDGSIHIDIHAGVNGEGTMLFTAAHELTHFIREWSPAKFKVFADFLLEQYGKKGVSVDALVNEQIAKAKRNGRDISYDTAYEEVIADSCEAMLADGDAVAKIAELKAKDKTLWQKIKDFLTRLVARIRSAYEGMTPDSVEGRYVAEMLDSAEKLKALWTEALVEASDNYTSAEKTLFDSGIAVDSKTESASLMSVRDLLNSEQQQKVAKTLAERFGVTVEEAENWISAETSLASLILNPKYSQYLDYVADPNEEAVKSNSDYPQGTVDFSNICKKRRDFTEVMNRVLRNFPNHVFEAADLAKIRTIMSEEGMEVACGICYVEDRRQLDSIVAQDFIDSLALYRKGSKTRPDGKAFNANQLKALKLIDGDSYIPSIYELISLEGRNSLKAKNPAMEEAWVKFNNARGMQSVRLLLNDAEYKRQILDYKPSVVKRKNDLGGLRIYSFSDMEMFHLIDIIQVITDSATVGLSLQGYTKVNEYAKAVKDTGEKLNRSLIPKGDLGYHMENGRIVLDYDTVEGIDVNHPDFFDNIDNPNVGNIVIGINATQIKAAMTSKFIDQIIPFHTGQSNEVLGEKGIATWQNYKDFQSERDLSTGKKSSHQINIYTEVIQAAEEEGKPITNKVDFVNKFLEVCKKNNLEPRFSEFLNVDENGDYIYTEGYHKFLVDFKTFDQNTGEYLPQMPVKPIFENKYITQLLKDYVKTQNKKDADFSKAIPKVLDRITNEIVKPKEKLFSDRDSLGNELSAEQKEFFKNSKVRDKKGNLMVLYHGTTANFNTFKKGDVGFHFGTKGAARGRVGFGKNVNIKEVYLNITNPIVFDEDLGSWDADYRLTRELYYKGILTQAEAESVLFTDDRMYKRTTETANRKLASVLLEKGYDGISYSNTFETKKVTTSYIVFNSNQAKEISNKAPTSNPDIRYSDRSFSEEFKTETLDSFGIKKINDYIHVQRQVFDTLLDEGFFTNVEKRSRKDTNEESGMVIETNKSSINETFNEDNYKQLGKFKKIAKLATVRMLPEIIKKGKLIGDNVPNQYQNSTNKTFAYISYDTETDGIPVTVKLDIKKSPVKNKLWVHSIITEKNSTGQDVSSKNGTGTPYRTDAIGEIIPQDTESVKREFSDADIKYSIREEAPPKKTKEGYKVFVVKNGKLYPPMVANPNAEDTPVGVWLNADVGARAPDSKTGRAQVKAGGKGTQGGSGSLAFRPGWHLGETPLATQFDRTNPETGVKELFPENFVWALCDIAADHDYQDEAMSYGYTKNGKFQHSLAGLPKLPTDGYYKYRTNPNPDTVPWLITGAMKVKKLLSDADVNAILKEKGLAPKQRVGGEKTLADLGLSEYEGKLFSDRDTDSVSNRSLLANALEGVAQNDIERKKLEEYKGKIALIESEQAKLADVRKRANDIRFTKGRTAEETKRMKDLDFEANQIANRINTYDKQLLNLESTKALKGVLEREKQMAYKRAEQKGKEALDAYRERATNTQRELLTRYQESRKKNVESRKQTAMRHKIKDVVSELNQYLLKGTKDKHVPIELQKPVAEALDAVNMDTVGAKERLAEIHKKLEKDPLNPELLESYRRIAEQGERMDGKLQALKNAYDEIVNSDDSIIANSHDEVISNSIAKVIKEVGSTPLRNMNLEQLEMVYDMYRMVLHSIRTANKTFKAEKGKEISVLANTVISDLDGKKRTPLNPLDNSFAWNNLKPVYAFERIGSRTFTKLFNAVRAGEDVWARDMSEAQAFREEQAKKYKYDSFDFDKKYPFTTHRGNPFELNLGEMMSIYAFAKDEHSKGHLVGEGFVFDPKKEAVKKIKGGIEIKVNLEDATSYNLSEEIVEEIVQTLSKIPGAMDFVDAMQDYLSTTMGEKGNEVSLELYQIKLFKNKNYFPLKSAPQYMAVAKEQVQGDVKIKNKGFTKDRKEGAKNPIVLSSFMDVWASHVNEMSMYHAFTLPLEDFYRVFNYKTPRMDGYAPMSVNASLENAYGNGATQYIDQLLKDLNGGARVDPTAGIVNKMTGLFKKSAVFASLSVVVQQPSAIARATALVDTKYFVGKPSGKHKETWAEVKKYAPVAVIKEMGYFDTGMGQSSVQWLKGDKTWKDKLDDIASKAPALADELAWCAIWKAVKRETLHTNKNLKPGSEEFLKAVGERFTEVVTKTQVYDSVLARSANMRSKDTGMKMVTAFMGEPTTSINMLQDALTQGKRGNKRYARKAIGGVVSSMILNSILVSLVYAGRDDDEDKTYAEKYVGTLTEELLDSINPLTLIPFVKDIVSIVQGYDVERSDMAVITDIINAWNNLDNDSRSAYRKVEDFAGAIASIFGLPVKNIMRDARGIYNTVNSFVNGEQTTGAGIKDSIVESITGNEKSNGQRLYEAILSGDTAQVERVKGRFKDQKAIDSAIRTALRDNDPRIKQAAEARYNGNIAEYMRIAKEIIAEGNFSQDNIVSAINSEITALKKGEGTSESTTSSNKVTSIYKVDDYYASIVGRDQATAYVVKEDLIKTDVANGKDREEAEADFNSKFASHLRDLYEAGELSDYEAQEMLVNYGGKSYEDAYSKVQYWEFKKSYPDYDLSEEAVKKYYNEVEPYGIGIDVYYDYSKQRAKCKGVDANGDGKTDSGSVKSEVMQVINSLPLTYQQKDALYYLNGWSASTIWEAPWH